MHEIEEKVERLARLAAARGLGGILLNTQPNFAWLTGGRSNQVDGSRENGSGSLLVSARGMRRPEVIAAVVLRTGLGALLGLALAWLFHLEGTGAAIAIIGAAAPIGFTSVVLSAREGLDLDLAASAAAISVFLGSLWIPLAMLFVPR